MASVGAISGLRVLEGETRNAASVNDGARAVPVAPTAAHVPVAFRSIGEDARRAPAPTVADSHRVAEQGTAVAFAPPAGRAPQGLASNPFLAQLIAQEQPTASRDDSRLTAVHPKQAFAAYREILDSPLLAAARAGVEVVSTGSNSFDLEA